jgi:hypothetical protein
VLAFGLRAAGEDPLCASLGQDHVRDQLHGAVVIDDEGRVVDNTGVTGAAKQGWLRELAGQRWLCLAGTTLGYSCQPIRG